MAAYALTRFTSPNAGVSVNQAVTDQYIAAAYGLALKNLDVNAVGIAIANTFTSAGTLDLSAASDTAGLKLPSKAGAVPTADGFLAFDTTAHRPVVGENGSTLALATVTGTETFTNKTIGSGTAMALGSDATGDIYYRAAGGALTRLAVGSSSQFLGGGTVPAWATPASSLTVVGTTFATSATTMTNANQYYTGVTLGSALTNAKKYLLSATANLQATGTTSQFQMEIYDSTNSVIVWAGNAIGTISGDQVQLSSPLVEYSGFASGPTIICRCRSSNAGDVILNAGAVGSTGNKTTGITALQYA